MYLPHVLAVHRSESHTFHKYPSDTIRLIKGEGVEGDAHCGKYVKHRSRVARNPKTFNLRQVHLIQAELFESLSEQGFNVTPGLMGENITTRGIDLLTLPYGTILTIGNRVSLMVTGLRNPCNQINGIQSGLMQAVLDKDKDGNLIRRAGIMSIVLKGGEVKAGDEIEVIFPKIPYTKLEPV